MTSQPRHHMCIRRSDHFGCLQLVPPPRAWRRRDRWGGSRQEPHEVSDDNEGDDQERRGVAAVTVHRVGRPNPTQRNHATRRRAPRRVGENCQRRLRSWGVHIRDFLAQNFLAHLDRVFSVTDCVR